MIRIWEPVADRAYAVVLLRSRYNELHLKKYPN